MWDRLRGLGGRPMDERQALWDRVLRAQEDERGALEAMNWTSDREAREMLAVEAEAARRRHAYALRLLREVAAASAARGAEGVR